METPASGSAGAGPRASRGWAWYGLLAAAYLAAAIPLAYSARDAINPDGVSYVQTARHWAAGRGDLAVNGWFSPLLSWLLMPAAWGGVEPFAAARGLGVLYGLLFAAGTVRLTGALGGRRFCLWAFGAALLLSLRTVFAEITPDFLMAAGLTWFFALSAELIVAPAIGKGIVAGLVGGACYLAKAYALPVVLVTLAMSALFRWLMARREAGPVAGGEHREAAPTQGGAATKPQGGAASKRQGAAPVPPTAPRRPGTILTFALAMGSAVLVSAPWIAAISAQFGRFTTSTAASLAARSWKFPPGVQMKGGHPHYAIHRPREGRITVWEDPAEARGTWAQWDVAGGGSWSWDYQWKTIAFNLEDLARHLDRSDVLMTLSVGWAAALVMAGLWRPAAPQRYLWVWACLAVAVYLGGYVLLYLYERFTWGAWGVLVALAAGVLTRLAEGRTPTPHPARRKSSAAAPPSSAWRTASVVLAVVVLASIGYRLVERIQEETGNPTSESRMGAWIRQAAEGFARKGQGASIASNDWAKGLYFSYWSVSVFLGQHPTAETRRDDPGRELRPLAPLTVVAFESPEFSGLAAALERAPGFTAGRKVSDPASHWRLVELAFEPGASAPAAGR